jgi:dihydropyrimidinase
MTPHPAVTSHGEQDKDVSESFSPVDLLIKVGQVVSGSGVNRLDVGISAGKVAWVAPDASPAAAMRVIDATRQTVLPGVVDVHNHPLEEDDMEAISRGAVHGGVTTMVPLISAARSWAFRRVRTST